MKKKISYLYNHKNLALALALVSMAALVSAYVAQYGFDLQPCILCLYQRKPYFAVIVLGLGAYFLAKKHRKDAFILLLLAGLSFVIGAAIAGFHVGVEQKWWTGLQSCGGGLPEGLSIDALKKYLEGRAVVRCDIPAWTLFGVSMAGYNFLLSSFLATLTFICTFKGKKK